MTRKILGLDIRHDAVSAVLVKNSIKENVIESYESVPIPDQQDFESGMAASLETIVEKINIAGSICIASFPADQISYRNIQVPFKGLKKISKILPFELEPTIPFPVDDLVIDFANSIVLEERGRRDRRSSSNIYELSYQGHSAKLVYEVVSKLLNTLIETTMSSARTDTAAAQVFLDRQIAEDETRLIAAEQKLAAFKRANVGFMPDEEGGYYNR